jgi:Ni,Fe-hydrogenase III large subunit/Ni,Fe-hydrogenase III component G
MQETLPRMKAASAGRAEHLRTLLAAFDEPARDALAPLVTRLSATSTGSASGDLVLDIPVAPEQFVPLAQALLAADDAHFADLFADSDPSSDSASRSSRQHLHLHLLLAFDHEHVWAQVRTPLQNVAPSIASLVETLPAVNWYEREIADEAGIVPLGHPHLRRLRLPASWPEDAHPLRRAPDELLAVTSRNMPAESAEARIPLYGLDDEREVLDPGPEGVVEYPLGPVRSGVVESGHYTLRTAGEEIVDVRLQLFYKHRGIEHRGVGLGAMHLPLVAERISGISGFANALATCEALERAAQVIVPDRARYLRTFFAELERLYNHLGYQADLCQATGLVVGQAQFDLLKERVLRLNGRLTGHRYLFGACVFGGVSADLTAEQLNEAHTLVADVRHRLRRLGTMLFDSPSHVDRLENTGILQPEDARAWGVVGPIARASGVDRDVRRDHPYAAYGDLAFDVHVLSEGDALARARVRLEETAQTIRLLEQVIEKLPGGPVRAAKAELPSGATALGWVESPRGEVCHWIRLDTAGTVARYRVRTASFANAQAFPLCIPGRNILTDFPVIEQSWALSYAGADR